jgi:hypothetical protein
MTNRRPVAAFFIALALFGGGATSMTACSAAGGDTSRNDGDTSDNDTSNNSGSNPSGVSQGNLPDNSTPSQGSERDEDSGSGGNG